MQDSIAGSDIRYTTRSLGAQCTLHQSVDHNTCRFFAFAWLTAYSALSPTTDPELLNVRKPDLLPADDDATTHLKVRLLISILIHPPRGFPIIIERGLPTAYVVSTTPIVI